MGDYWDGRSLYERLEIEPTATAAEVEAAYQLLVRVWHPDNKPSKYAAQCQARFQGLQVAYEILIDPLRRERYDISFVPSGPAAQGSVGPFEDALWNHPEVWFSMASWMKDEDSGTGFQRKMAFTAGDYLQRGREPSEKQLPHMLQARDAALADGFDPNAAFVA